MGLPKALAFLVVLAPLLAVPGWTEDDRAAVLEAGRIEPVAGAETRWGENEVGENAKHGRQGHLRWQG